MKSIDNTIYLVGGFMVNDNFGDVIQAKLWVDWYRIIDTKIVFICYESGIKTCKNNLKLSDDEIMSSNEFLLNKEIVGFLHLYGGGYLNKYWSDDFVEIIKHGSENNLKIFATGVQVDKDYYKKSLDYKIDYLSVREPISKEIVRGNPFIIDDSLGYFFSRRIYFDVTFWFSRFVKKNKVLLQLSLNPYIYDSEDDLKKIKDLVKKFICETKEKYQVTLASSFPETVEGPIENKKYIENLGLDIKDFEYTITKKLENKLIDGYEFVVVNSYHTYLMAVNKYNCPVFFLAFNEYYRQKAKSLQEHGFLNEETLITDPEKLSQIMNIKDRSRIVSRKQAKDVERKFKTILEKVKVLVN